MIPPLTPEELTKFGSRMYGARRWRTPLAAAIGMSRPAISLYASGRNPIPAWVTIAVRKLYAEHRAARSKARVMGER
jgi:hypothetical protein